MKNGEYELIIAPKEYIGNLYRGRYCYNHHYIWWLNTGYILKEGECIHHKDEDKMNNEFSNLEIRNIDEHRNYHSSKRGKNMVTIKCPNCGYVFNRERRQTHLSKKGFMTFCSRECMGKFNPIQKRININDKINIGRDSIIKEYID